MLLTHEIFIALWVHNMLLVVKIETLRCPSQKMIIMQFSNTNSLHCTTRQGKKEFGHGAIHSTAHYNDPCLCFRKLHQNSTYCVIFMEGLNSQIILAVPTGNLISLENVNITLCVQSSPVFSSSSSSLNVSWHPSLASQSFEPSR